MYDAIVVGARCAGSPTAMLLARKGYKVLLVDKANFPSDTLSTHVIWPHGAEIMERWGLYDALAETNCPPIALNMTFDVGPMALKGGVPGPNEGRGGFCPRRTVLDKILVDAAVASGVELREDFTVDELLWEVDRVVGIKGHGRNGGPVEERARIVIGADGIHSFVAKAVSAEEYDAYPPLVAAYYSYWSGFDADDVEQYVRPHGGFAIFPTNNDLTLIVAGWQSARFREIRQDIEGHAQRQYEQAPSVTERLKRAKREDKWYGTAGVPNYFRKPYGNGWALAGDAGYIKDFLTAQGISDAFIDAEGLAEAIDAGFSERRPLEEALAEHQESRDQHVKPLYDFSRQLATLEPPSPEMQQLFRAMAHNQEATNQFFSAITGAIPMHEFFAPENMGKIFAAAGTSA